MKTKNRYYLIGLFALLFLSVTNYAQTDTTSGTQSEGNIEQMKSNFAKGMGEFFDVRMLDHSIQTRGLVKKHGLKDSLKTFTDLTDGKLNIAIISSLNVEELWPNVLNRKKYYSVDGKFDVDTTDMLTNTDSSNYIIALTVTVDTLQNQAEYGVQITGIVDNSITTFLASKGIYNLNDSINQYFVGYFAQHPGPWTKPNEAPVADAVMGLLAMLNDIFEPFYDELIMLQLVNGQISETFEHANEGYHVKFSPSINQKFGFDYFDIRWKKWVTDYDFAQMEDGKIYKVNVKSTKKNFATETVKATFIDTANVGGTITFKTDKGESVAETHTGNEYILTLPTFSSNGTKIIYAYKGADKLGKLTIEVYGGKSEKVVIVPVNCNLTLTDSMIANYLDMRYKSGVVDWEVAVKPTWTNTSWDSLTPGKLESADATLMTKYSPEMRALRNAYFDSQDSTDKHAYYIFVVDDFTSPNQAGYMAIGKSIGFVKKGTEGAALKRLIAHELGHGAFGLRHKFDEIPQASSNRLMDYVSATHLCKREWDEIHSILPDWSRFDDEEEGAYVGYGNMSVLLPYADEDEYLTFIDIDGRLISLPYGNLTGIYFTDYPEKLKYGLPMGLLYGFSICNVRFHAKIENGSFIEYEAIDPIPNDIVCLSIPKFPSESSYVLKGQTCFDGNKRNYKILYGTVADIVSQNSISLNNLRGKYSSFISEVISQEYINQYSSIAISLNSDYYNLYSDLSLSIDGLQVEYNEGIIDTQLSWITHFINIGNIESGPICGNDYYLARTLSDIFIKHPELQYCLNDMTKILHVERTNAIESYFPGLPIINAETLQYSQEEYASLHPNSKHDFFQYWLKITTNLSKKIEKIDLILGKYVNSSTIDNIDVGGLADELIDEDVDINVDDLDCFLLGLTFEERVIIWEQRNEPTVDDDKDQLFLKVLKQTPKNQFTKVINYFSKDLDNRIDEMIFDLDAAKEIQFISYLTLMSLNGNSTEFEYMPNDVFSGISFDQNDLNNCGSFSYKFDNQSKSLWPYEIDTYNGILMDGDYFKIWDKCYNDYRYIKPFEMVPFVIHQHTQLASPLGYNEDFLQSGKVYWAPAIYVWYLDISQNFSTNMQNAQVCIDVFAIIVGTSAIISGDFGGGVMNSIWTLGEIISTIGAVVDFSLVTEEKFLSKYGTQESYVEYKEFEESIAPLINVINALDIAYAVASITKFSVKYIGIYKIKNKGIDAINDFEKINIHNSFNAEGLKIIDELDSPIITNFDNITNQSLGSELGWTQQVDEIIPGTNKTVSELQSNILETIKAIDGFKNIGKLGPLRNKLADAFSQLQLRLASPSNRAIFVVEDGMVGVKVSSESDLIIGNLATAQLTKGDIFSEITIPAVVCNSQTLNLLDDIADIEKWMRDHPGVIEILTELYNQPVRGPTGSISYQNIFVVKHGNEVRIIGELASAMKNLANGGGSLLTKIDNLGLSSLTTKLDDIGSVSKTRFLDEFADASDNALIALNNRTDLVDYWKINGNVIKNKTYPNVSHRPWATTKQEILSNAKPSEVKILNAIENSPLPTNSQVAVAGAYSDELGGSVIIKYNNKNFDVNLLEPELKQHIDYLQMIKNDFDDGGHLYQKLYSNVPLQKIQNAQDAGIHAEVLATNEVIKLLKTAGKFNSIQDLNKIEVLVRGRALSFGNMCRCPHCFHIIEGVKMIGNQ